MIGCRSTLRPSVAIVARPERRRRGIVDHGTGQRTRCRKYIGLVRGPRTPLPPLPARRRQQRATTDPAAQTEGSRDLRPVGLGDNGNDRIPRGPVVERAVRLDVAGATALSASLAPTWKEHDQASNSRRVSILIANPGRVSGMRADAVAGHTVRSITAGPYACAPRDVRQQRDGSASSSPIATRRRSPTSRVEIDLPPRRSGADRLTAGTPAARYRHLSPRPAPRRTGGTGMSGSVRSS